MKILRSFLVLIPILLLAGCATLTRHERAILQAQGVSPAVYNKMMVGDPLTLSDIVELSHREVPPGIIIDYLRDTDARYRLRKDDVKRLRAAGVDESVIAYLLSTAPAYPGPYYGPEYYPYGPRYYPYGPAWYPYDPWFYPEPAIYVGGGFRHRWDDDEWHGRGEWHEEGHHHHH